jgi:hypothetical protein
MSNSDLRARPIFHHQRDPIEAHLAVVFAALAEARSPGGPRAAWAGRRLSTVDEHSS